MNRLLSLLFDKKILRLPLYFWMSIPFILYIIWEIYWAGRVRYSFIKWHTHLMPFVLVGWTALAFVRRLHSPTAIRIFKAAGSILFSLFIAEAFLIALGGHLTSVALAGPYSSPYGLADSNYYHTWKPFEPHLLYKPQFSFWRPTNSLGLPDREWPLYKKPGQKRILALGDSFTEGDGAPFDSSYVAQLTRMITLSGHSAFLMNGGVCGSDPFFNYIMLRDRLLAYRPDIVLQSVGSGDMNGDIAFRGGLERFQKDGTIKVRPGPWWEPIYAVSCISRIFFTWAGYNVLLINELSAHEKEIIDRSVMDLFARYAELCHRNHMECVVVFHPQENEVDDNKYNYDFAPLIHYLQSDLNMHVVDLLPSYRSYIKHAHTGTSQFFWDGDGHHNSKGYTMMAETTLENIRPFLNSTHTIAK